MYVGCTVSAARSLRGRARAAAVPAAVATLAIDAFCGWWALLPIALAAGSVAVDGVRRHGRRRPATVTSLTPCSDCGEHLAA